MIENSNDMQASAAFPELRHAYEHRLDAARVAHQRGQKVVGYVGNTVPVELIMAAGCMPVRIAPVAGDASAADQYIESFSDLDMRRIFALYCNETYDFLDLLVIPRSSESQHKLFLSLREAQRTGIVTNGPKLYLYDILHTQRPSSHTYGLARTRELQQALAALGGVDNGDASLRVAIEQSNVTRRHLQTLQQRRLDAAVGGHASTIASGTTRFMATQEANRALSTCLSYEHKSVHSGPRLLVKGCPLDHTALHALVERAGGVIVMEDDEWGSRAAAPLIATDGDPLTAVFEHYYRDVPCTRVHPSSTIGAWFAQALSNEAVDGVLFYLPKPDDIYGWSFPAERDAVNASGKPWLLIRQDAREQGDLSSRLKAFVAAITPK